MPSRFYLSLMMSSYIQQLTLLLSIPPVVSVSTNFKVSDRRKGNFKATCTSIGGRAQKMFIRGPFGVVDNLAITPLGVVNGTWNDSYFTESPGEDGRNGDIIPALRPMEFPTLQMIQSSKVSYNNIICGNHLLVAFKEHYCFSSGFKPHHYFSKADISYISDSGVESAIRRSHSDWICSTLQ